MITEEVLAYVKAERARGSSPDEISQKLRAEQWTEEDIAQIIKVTDPAYVPSEVPVLGQVETVVHVAQTPLPGFKQLLSESWAMLKDRFLQVFVTAVVPTLLATIVIGTILFIGILSFGKLSSGAGLMQVAISMGAAFVAIIVLVIVTSLSWIAVMLRLNAPKEATTLKQSMKDALPKFLPYLWVSIILSAVIMGGAVLLIVPGIIFAIWFYFALWINVLEGDKGLNALFKSREYVRGNVKRILFYVLMFILLGILGQVISIPFRLIMDGVIPIDNLTLKVILAVILGVISIGYSLILQFLTFFAVFVIYKKLKVQKGAVIVDTSTKRKVKFALIGWFGIIVLPIIFFTVILTLLNEAREKGMQATTGASEIAQLAIVAGQSDGVVYESSTGITITMPQGWILAEEIASDGTAYFIASDTTVSVLRAMKGFDDYQTINDMADIDLIVNEIKGNNSTANLVFDVTEQIIIAGTPAYKLGYDYDDPERGLSYNVEYVFIKNGHLYDLTFLGTSEAKNTLIPAADSIVAGIK